MLSPNSLAHQSTSSAAAAHAVAIDPNVSRRRLDLYQFRWSPEHDSKGSNSPESKLRLPSIGVYQVFGEILRDRDVTVASINRDCICGIEISL
jgi:hypothetical protein